MTWGCGVGAAAAVGGAAPSRAGQGAQHGAAGSRHQRGSAGGSQGNAAAYRSAGAKTPPRTRTVPVRCSAHSTQHTECTVLVYHECWWPSEPHACLAGELLKTGARWWGSMVETSFALLDVQAMLASTVLSKSIKRCYRRCHRAMSSGNVTGLRCPCGCIKAVFDRTPAASCSPMQCAQVCAVVGALACQRGGGGRMAAFHNAWCGAGPRLVGQV